MDGSESAASSSLRVCGGCSKNGGLESCRGGRSSSGRSLLGRSSSDDDIPSSSSPPGVLSPCVLSAGTCGGSGLSSSLVTGGESAGDSASVSPGLVAGVAVELGEAAGTISSAAAGAAVVVGGTGAGVGATTSAGSGAGASGIEKDRGAMESVAAGLLDSSALRVDGGPAVIADVPWQSENTQSTAANVLFVSSWAAAAPSHSWNAVMTSTETYVCQK